MDKFMGGGVQLIRIHVVMPKYSLVSRRKEITFPGFWD